MNLCLVNLFVPFVWLAVQCKQYLWLNLILTIIHWCWPICASLIHTRLKQDLVIFCRRRLGDRRNDEDLRRKEGIISHELYDSSVRNLENSQVWQSFKLDRSCQMFTNPVFKKYIYELTHLPLVPHICISELVTYWFITWTNADFLSIWILFSFRVTPRQKDTAWFLTSPR